MENEISSLLIVKGQEDTGVILRRVEKKKKKTLSYWKDIVKYYWKRLALHISVYIFFFCYNCAFLKIKYVRKIHI